MQTLLWDLLDGLGGDDVETVLSLASSLHLREGETIFGLGDEALAVYLVAEGTVRLTLPLAVGNRQVDGMVGERTPGHLVGLSGLVSPHRFTVKATATSASLLLSLKRSDLLELFTHRPALGSAIYGNVARIVGQRLQVFQTLWIREMQHVVKARTP
jgi:CRP-like cAMP-binding protein